MTTTETRRRSWQHISLPS